jgi:hypothetical protein
VRSRPGSRSGRFSDASRLYRARPRKFGFVAGVAVIAMPQVTFGTLQQLLGFAHQLRGGRGGPRSLGRLHGLAGIAHFLHRRASAPAQRRYGQQQASEQQPREKTVHAA